MGSSRPLLVILTVVSGVDFPAAPGAQLYMKVAAVPAPSFGTELAWEVGEEQVRELRRKRAAVRVEVLREQELLGHKMLDIRTAVRVQESGQAATTPHRLKGCSVASLRLGLGLGLVLQDEEDRHMEAEVVEGCLTPGLVEGEGKGYFQLGPSTQDTARWGRQDCHSYVGVHPAAPSPGSLCVSPSSLPPCCPPSCPLAPC